jgi:hypothetical protein
MPYRLLYFEQFIHFEDVDLDTRLLCVGQAAKKCLSRTSLAYLSQIVGHYRWIVEIWNGVKRNREAGMKRSQSGAIASLAFNHYIWQLPSPTDNHIFQSCS